MTHLSARRAEAVHRRRTSHSVGTPTADGSPTATAAAIVIDGTIKMNSEMNVSNHVYNNKQANIFDEFKYEFEFKDILKDVTVSSSIIDPDLNDNSEKQLIDLLNISTNASNNMSMNIHNKFERKHIATSILSSNMYSSIASEAAVAADLEDFGGEDVYASGVALDAQALGAVSIGDPLFAYEEFCARLAARESANLLETIRYVLRSIYFMSIYRNEYVGLYIGVSLIRY